MKYLIITIITGLLIINGLKAIQSSYADQVNSRHTQIETILNQE